MAWLHLTKNREYDSDTMPDRVSGRRRIGADGVASMSEVEGLTQRDKFPRYYDTPSFGRPDEVEQFDFMYTGLAPSNAPFSAALMPAMITDPRTGQMRPMSYYELQQMQQLQMMQQAGADNGFRQGMMPQMPQAMPQGYSPQMMPQQHSQQEEVYVPKPKAPQSSILQAIKSAQDDYAKSMPEGGNTDFFARLQQARSSAPATPDRPEATPSQDREERVKILSRTLRDLEEATNITVQTGANQLVGFWVNNNGYTGFNRVNVNHPTAMLFSLMDRQDPSLEDEIVNVPYGNNIGEFEANLQEFFLHLYERHVRAEPSL